MLDLVSSIPVWTIVLVFYVLVGIGFVIVGDVICSRYSDDDKEKATIVGYSAIILMWPILLIALLAIEPEE